MEEVGLLKQSSSSVSRGVGSAFCFALFSKTKSFMRNKMLKVQNRLHEKQNGLVVSSTRPAEPLSPNHSLLTYQ